jgi:hypothetical protein
MVGERNAVAGNCVECWQRVIDPSEQPVSPLVTYHEDDVVGRLAGGIRARRLAFLSPREGIPENHDEAHACRQLPTVFEEFPFHARYPPADHSIRSIRSSSIRLFRVNR